VRYSGKATIMTSASTVPVGYDEQGVLAVMSYGSAKTPYRTAPAVLEKAKALGWKLQQVSVGGYLLAEKAARTPQ
jgi:hypothetical protein